MTPSPETRAKAALGRRLETLPHTRAAIEKDIATAIREAEDAALERASAFLVSETTPQPGKSISVGDELLMHGASWSAHRIRSLKSKDT